MPTSVLLSYRDDMRDVAVRLAGGLGPSRVLMGVGTIDPDAEAVAAAVASCDVLVVLIGTTWSSVTDVRGRRRLDDPGDLVAGEIEAALRLAVRIVPVLVDGAGMPARSGLPAGLQALADLRPVRIADTGSGVDAVVRAVDAGSDAPDPAVPTNSAPPARISPVIDRPAGWFRRRTKPAAAAAPPPQPGDENPLTADDVHRIAFTRPPIGRRGYDMDQVDAFLDLVENALRAPGSTRMTAADVQGVLFGTPPIGRRGYSADQVDAFLDRAARALGR